MMWTNQQNKTRRRLAKKAMKNAFGASGKFGISMGSLLVMCLIYLGMQQGSSPWQVLQAGRRLTGLSAKTAGVEIVAAAVPDELEKEKEMEATLEKEVTAQEEETDKMVEEESNMGIAVMLSGSLTFMMGVFYCVNNQDDDIRRYSWQVISATISIFSAVLLFSAVNGIVEHLSEEILGEGEILGIVVGFVHLLCWYAGMQFVLAGISGAIDVPFAPKRDQQKLDSFSPAVQQLAFEARVKSAEAMEKNDDNMEEDMKEFIEGETDPAKAKACHNDMFINPKNDIKIEYLEKVADALRKNPKATADDLLPEASHFLLELCEQREDWKRDMVSDMECWAVLFGHITGFAAIHAWGELQQLIGKHSPFVAIATIVPAYLCMSGLFICMQLLREKIMLDDDGIKDVGEEQWEDTTAETEDDVMALMMSFLCTQSIRFFIAGGLPNAEGIEAPELRKSHSVTQACLLIGTGCGLMAFIGYRTVKFGDIEVEEEKFGKIAARFINRLSEHNRLIIAMIFAWTLYFGTVWFMAANFYGQVSDMMLEVLTTMVNSFMAFGLIFCFDKIQDSDSTDAKVDIVLGKVITALAVLIGFAWEHCFDKATEVLADKMPVHPSCYPKLGLAILIGLVVIPAWRWYIVPLCIELKEEAEEKEKEQMEELKLQQEAEAEAHQMIKKWKRQGLKPLETEEKLVETFLAKKKKQAEKAEEGKKAGTSVERLNGMQPYQLVNLVQKLEKENHSTEIDIKRFEHSQKAQVQRVHELERRGKELEEVIYGFQQETEELQKLVDRLTKQPGN